MSRSEQGTFCLCLLASSCQPGVVAGEHKESLDDLERREGCQMAGGLWAEAGGAKKRDK